MKRVFLWAWGVITIIGAAALAWLGWQRRDEVLDLARRDQKQARARAKAHRETIKADQERINGLVKEAAAEAERYARDGDPRDLSRAVDAYNAARREQIAKARD